MKNARFVFIPSLLVFLVSCNVSNPTPPTPAPDIPEGFSKPDSMSYVARDLDSNYATSLGEQKMLVIPISLSGDQEYSWTDKNLSDINTYYFGEKEDTPNEWNSLSSYYHTASLGKLTITGAVTHVYESAYQRSDFYGRSAGQNWQNLMSLINAAADWAGKEGGINLDEYDYDDNGYIDSIHLIVDATDGGDWGSTLWPHMSQTGFSQGTNKNPKPYTYSLSNLGHVSDARTSVHEQGHIFGLQDYYDYKYEYNLVGGADMQSFNCFDWNGFSKMSMNWVTPYVYDNKTKEARITIEPSSLSGDYVLIPAGDWNGSAYDEYLLIELFTKVGNNKLDWLQWYTSYDKNLKTGGIRVHHVDARLMGYDYDQGGYVEIEGDLNESSYQNKWLINDNTKGYSSSYVPSSVNKDYGLLQVIQKQTTPTFEEAFERYLDYQDLFQTGDSISIDTYQQYFKNDKSGVWNNGEDFDVTITFEEVTEKEATIVISKNS